jgi:hypothetical protein
MPRRASVVIETPSASAPARTYGLRMTGQKDDADDSQPDRQGPGAVERQ